MSKSVIGILGFLGVGVLALVIAITMAISFHNKEVGLRNTIVNKQTDNKNEMDAMWKSISQVAQVTEKDRASLMEIFNSYATARTGEGGGKSIVNWVKEAVPTVDNKTMLNLQNVIVAQRDGFKFRQKEILDLKREHDNTIDKFPGMVFATILGRKKIDVVIVTSTRTEDAFKSGKDDDTKLFN